jgi:hypothetical protein
MRLLVENAPRRAPVALQKAREAASGRIEAAQPIRELP